MLWPGLGLASLPGSAGEGDGFGERAYHAYLLRGGSGHRAHRSWFRPPGPDQPGGSGGIGHRQALRAAAVSAATAWAVGQARSIAHSQTLILAWNGRVWKRVPSAEPGWRHPVRRGGHLRPERLGGRRHHGSTTLILRWNGRVWKRVPSPAGGTLFGVAASSARNAWVVGRTSNDQTLILRWNGRVWKRVPSPGAPEGSALSAVAATSARSAWVVGTFVKDGAIGTLTEHWNGRVWKRVPSPYGPNRRTSPTWLSGVAATSARSASAVGSGPNSSLALHWSGRAWQRVVPHPRPGWRLLPERRGCYLRAERLDSRRP